MIGDTVELRLVEEQDLPLLVRWHNEPHNRQRLFTPFLVNAYKQRKLFEASLKDQTRSQFIIVRCEDHVPIGTVSLEYINYRNQDCMLGPFLVEPGESGDERELDAGKTVLSYAFQSLNMHRVETKVYAFDRAELEVREKLGFVQERVERESIYLHGKFENVVALGILRDEWYARERAVRQAAQAVQPVFLK